MVAGIGVGGVIFSLEGVPKDDDELNSGVSMDGEVEVAAWHFVYFVDDQHTGGFEEGSFPGGYAPSSGRGKLESLLPFAAKLGGWD